MLLAEISPFRIASGRKMGEEGVTGLVNEVIESTACNFWEENGNPRFADEGPKNRVKDIVKTWRTLQREAGSTGNSSVWEISVCGRGEGEKNHLRDFSDESDMMIFRGQTWLEARDSHTKHCNVKLGSPATGWCGLFQVADEVKVKKHNITTFP